MKQNEVNQIEQWIAIEINPSYEISNTGRLRKTFKNGKIIYLKPLKNGISNKYVWAKIDGKKHYIHKLVMEAFKGKRPDGYEIDHIDRNPLNNDLSNLRYVTKWENKLRGEEHARAILNENKVNFIRLFMGFEGINRRMMAQMFGVSRNTIADVITRRTWRHI